MVLRLCPQCRRHVAQTEIACPFCGAGLVGPTARPVITASRLGRAAVFAGATLASSACWTDAKPARTTPIEERKTVEGTPTTPPAGTIRGVIRNGDNGAPLPGVSVSILVDGNTIYATSNEQGIYEIKNLPPGTYDVEWMSGDPRERPQAVRVTLGDDVGALADLKVFFPEPDRGPCCKPYGAPPARRRFV